jgi:DNA-binding YbaB/EbfC family protein
MKLPKLPGGPGQMRQLMEQAQKMMEEAQQFEEQMEEMTVEAGAGGGVVKATVNGKGNLVGLVIAPDVVDPNDIEMLQDLIIGAVSEAQAKAEEVRAEKMQSLTGGLPPGLGFP